MKSGVVRLASLSLVAVVALVGCSGGGDDDKADSRKSTSPDSSAEAGKDKGNSNSNRDEDGDRDQDQERDKPDGESSDPADALTDPGSSLEIGEPARFTWRATAKVTGEAEVAVTRIDKASMKAFTGFKLSDAVKKSTPYYVHMKVTNTGEANLGGFEPPVFLDNGSSILYPPAQINSFGPCAESELPRKFAVGKSAKLCMVFLAPANTKLRTVALRPDEAQEQIDWTGKLTRPGTGKTAQKTQKSKKS